MTVLNVFNRNIQDSNLYSELKIREREREREREKEREDCMARQC